MDIKIMPSNTEMEEALLGCLISNPEVFNKCEEYLSDKEVWYDKYHGELWDILTSMKRKGEPIDLLTVTSNLSKEMLSGKYNKFWITGLIDQSYMPSNVQTYAKKLYEQHLYRKTVETAREISDKAYAGNSEVYEMLADTHTLIGNLIELQPSLGFDMGQVLIDSLTELEDKTPKQIKSGWKDIDVYGGGFTRGEVSIIGGRPGHGKTTMLINLLSNFIHAGYKVCMFNRELSIGEVIKKIACLESGKLSYKMIRNTQYDKDGLDEIRKTYAIMKELYSKEKFIMFDKVKTYKQSALEVKKFKPDIVIDDYIQLIQADGNGSVFDGSRRLQIETICNEYKWLAKAQNCVVIVASQLNRALEYRKGQNATAVPLLSDLAESGAIEQIAENVIFSHYEYKFSTEQSDSVDVSPHKIKAVLAKVRYGETGSHILGFDGDKCKIYPTYREFEQSRQ